MACSKRVWRRGKRLARQLVISSLLIPAVTYDLIFLFVRFVCRLPSSLSRLFAMVAACLLIYAELRAVVYTAARSSSSSSSSSSFHDMYSNDSNFTLSANDIEASAAAGASSIDSPSMFYLFSCVTANACEIIICMCLMCVKVMIWMVTYPRLISTALFICLLVING